jgi:hypothetical protein
LLLLVAGRLPAEAAVSFLDELVAAGELAAVVTFELGGGGRRDLLRVDAFNAEWYVPHQNVQHTFLVQAPAFLTAAYCRAAGPSRPYTQHLNTLPTVQGSLSQQHRVCIAAASAVGAVYVALQIGLSVYACAFGSPPVHTRQVRIEA